MKNKTRYPGGVSGTGQDIMKQTETDIPYLPNGRIRYIRDFLKDIHGHMENEQNVIPAPNCENDLEIMDIVLQMGLTIQQLKIIN